MDINKLTQTLDDLRYIVSPKRGIKIIIEVDRGTLKNFIHSIKEWAKKQNFINVCTNKEIEKSNFYRCSFGIGVELELITK